MLHHDSMKHILITRKLLESNDSTSLRYAALEIRMAIERLFYKLLPSYREELPDDVLKQWQPKKIIDALIDCDPDIESNYTLTFAKEQSDGSRGPSSVAGHYKAVNRKLLRQYYHKIGFYLHAPKDDKGSDAAKVRSFLNAAATRVEEYCQKTTIISNIAMFHTVQCVCGRAIKRNDRAVQIKPYIRCPNEKCRAVFDLVKNNQESTVEWKLREIEFVCPACKASNLMGVHLIDVGLRFSCVKCNQPYIVRSGYIVNRNDSIDPVDKVNT